ncbi:MAG: hypothetical protein ABI808_04495 [Pseudonocardiales bacterium]
MRFPLRSVAVVSAVSAVAGLLCSGVAMLVAASPACALDGKLALPQAAAYASARGVRTGIAVIDLRNGRTWTAGDSGSFGTASLVKTMIATKIILDGQMNGATADEAYEMIIGSNDGDATDLWNRFGGPDIIGDLAAHYGIQIGGPPLRAGMWGNTQITALGMARFYVAVHRDRAVWPWLHNAMAHTKRIADDGTMQYFGIPAAGGGHEVKQGWGTASAGDGYVPDAAVNSSGFVHTATSDYAVVILGQGHNDAGLADERGFEPVLGAVVTGVARLVLPIIEQAAPGARSKPAPRAQPVTETAVARPITPDAEGGSTC